MHLKFSVGVGVGVEHQIAPPLVVAMTRFMNTCRCCGDIVVRCYNINYTWFLISSVSCILQADERAVLKHFKWPEKKADAMREAAVEYRELKLLEQEISSYKDDPVIPYGASLKKMASLLDK